MNSAESSGGSVPPSSNICLTNTVLEDIQNLCHAGKYSDVTLVIDGRKFPVHKVILAARSQYFEALLFGDLMESSQTEIELKEVKVEPFKKLLQFIYTGCLSLAILNEKMVLEVLELSHRFVFIELEDGICNYLIYILNNDNVFTILKAGQLFQINCLVQASYKYMEKHARDIIKHEGWLQTSPETLATLTSRDSFNLLEIDLFSAILKWTKVNSGTDVGNVIENIRFTLMTSEELLTVVRSSGLVSSERILDAISTKIVCNKLNNDSSVAFENVATSEKGAKVIYGNYPDELLNGDTVTYTMDTGYSSHNMKDSGITIQLDTPCIINHMKMLLWDLDSRSYSYYVEISTDQNFWTCVTDHRDHYCRSWQHLYFEPSVVQYIRITGTRNTKNDTFHAVSLQASYVRHRVKLYNHIIAPEENVAIVGRGAMVDEKCLNSSVLLDGDFTSYDNEKGFTSPEKDSNCIMIHLGQPYIINSMRFLLWDCDDRFYSYYIEVSSGREDWEKVIDNSKKLCRSWQTLSFKATKPFVFIKITSTLDYAGEGLRCVHFECPSSVTDICSNNSD